MFDALIRFVREQYRTDDFIPLHAPIFPGKERDYVVDTINTTFVSSVGAFVDRFERDMAAYTQSPRAVATVNGTAALHVALRLAGVQPGELVITQPLTFVATCNAIAYCMAEPLFIDVDRHTLGLSPKALETWLAENARVDGDGLCRTNSDNKVIRACVPMHTFGHPVEIDDLIDVGVLAGSSRLSRMPRSRLEASTRAATLGPSVRLARSVSTAIRSLPPVVVE